MNKKPRGFGDAVFLLASVCGKLPKPSRLEQLKLPIRLSGLGLAPASSAELSPIV